MMIPKRGAKKMPHVLDTKEYLDTVCDLLSQGQQLVPVPVAGSSMTPFLHPGDTVYVDLPTQPLRKADIVLFTRPSGQYILHRIIKVNPDGSFIMLGDAQTEREYVDGPGRIHARVTKATHKGKLLTPRSLRWLFFATVWIWAAPLRPKLMALWASIKKTR